MPGVVQHIRVKTETRKAGRDLDAVSGKLERQDRLVDRFGVSARSSYGSAGRAAKGYGDDATRAARRVDAAVAVSQRGVGLMARAWKRARAAVAGYLALAAARELVQASRAAFDLAANVQEVDNRFRSVFGGTADDVDRFLDGLANAAGQTRTEARTTISAYGAMFKGLGDSAEVAAGKAQDAYAAAADLQSAANVDDAFERMTAGLSGSSEVFAKFGINVKEAALAEYALSEGITESTKSMSEAEKTTLRLKKIRADLQAQGALGDLLATADSDANRARALASAYRDAAEVAAVELLPTFAQVADAAEDALGTLDGATIGKFFGRVAFDVVAFARRVVLGLSQVKDAAAEWFAMLPSGANDVGTVGDVATSTGEAVYGLSDRLNLARASWSRYLARVRDTRAGIADAVAGMVESVVGGIDRMGRALQGFSFGGLTGDLGFEVFGKRFDLPDLEGLRDVEDGIQGIGERLGEATEGAAEWAASQREAAGALRESAADARAYADQAEDQVEADRQRRRVLDSSIEARRAVTDADRAALEAMGDSTDETESHAAATNADTAAVEENADALEKQRRELEEARRALSDLVVSRDLASARTTAERDAVRDYHDAVRELAEYQDAAGGDTPLAASVRALGTDAAAVLDARIAQLVAMRDAAKGARAAIRASLTDYALGADGEPDAALGIRRVEGRGPSLGRAPDKAPGDAVARGELAKAERAVGGYEDAVRSLRLEVEAGTVSEAEYGREAEAAKAQAADAVRGALAALAALGGTADQVDVVLGLLDGLGEAPDTSWALDLADDLADAADAADALAGMLDDVGAPKLGGIVRAGADLFSAGSGLAAGVASGNPMQIASGLADTVGAIGGMVGSFGAAREAARRQREAFEDSARAVRDHTDALLSGRVGDDVTREQVDAYDQAAVDRARRQVNAAKDTVIGSTGFGEAQGATNDVLRGLDAAGLDVSDLQALYADALATDDLKERRRMLDEILGEVERRFGGLSSALGTYGDDLPGALARYEDALRFGGESLQQAFGTLIDDLRELDLGAGWQAILDDLEGVEPGTPEWEAAVADLWQRIESDPSLIPEGMSRSDLERLFELRAGGPGGSDADRTNATSISHATVAQADVTNAYLQESLRVERSMDGRLAAIYAVLAEVSAPTAVPGGPVAVEVATGDRPPVSLTFKIQPGDVRGQILEAMPEIERELARRMERPRVLRGRSQ